MSSQVENMVQTASTEPCEYILGDESKDRLRTWLRMLKTTKMVEAEVREKLRVDFETTLPQFDVMAALYKSENGLKMSELSDELMVSNGNVTGIIDRLVDAELVVRLPVENDRRVMKVQLTTAGKNHFSKIAKCHAEWIDQMFGQLDETQRTSIRSQMALINR